MPDASEDAPAPSPKKTKSPGKAKKTKTTPSHPKVSDMVNTAIATLKERGGSSLQAIKKYIGAHYKVDVERLAPFIKKYLKTAVANGSLVQTKGKGASGSFRLSASGSKEKGAKKESAPKKARPAAKKPAKPKKPAVKKATKKPAAAKKPKPAKSPKKPKAKPKSPKPKKAKPAAKKSPKKTGRK